MKSLQGGKEQEKCGLRELNSPISSQKVNKQRLQSINQEHNNKNA